MKKVVDKIKELNKTTKGKAILFFSFYLVFFLIVVLVYRFGSHNMLPSGDEYEPGNGKVSLSIDKILAKNYISSYTVTLDGVVKEYYIKRNDQKELIEFNDKSYYRDKDNFYVKEGEWISVENPYLFPKFNDIEEFAKLMEVATYKSKISYEDGRKAYNYLISTNTINQIFDNINSDFLEEPNEIILEVDDLKNVNKIEMKLNSYCVLNKFCGNSLKVEIQYDMFGEVSGIVSPLR